MTDYVPDSYLLSPKRGACTLDNLLEELKAIPGVTIDAVMETIELVSVSCDEETYQSLLTKLGEKCVMNKNQIHKVPR